MSRFFHHPAPLRPSPAVAFVGRKNSGKTTLTEQIIAELCARGLDVASIKHHGHPDFDIDVPGKDSYRHRAAGAKTTAVLSSKRFALMEDLEHEFSCRDVLGLIPGHDIVVVEGFRAAGLPTFELFRAANERDQQALPAFLETLREYAAKRDAVQATERETMHEGGPKAAPAREFPEVDSRNSYGDPENPAIPVGVITDIPELTSACKSAGIPVFAFDDIGPVCDFVQGRFAIQPLTIAIQAGGESKRMGQSKARTPFLGRPLIEHMLDLLAPFADELIITTNEAEKLEYLHETYPDLRLVADVRPERGALPGLLTALSNSNNDLTAVVACDMIAFAPRILGLETNMLTATGADCVVPVTDGFYEPFASVYRIATCLPALERELARGTKRMQDFLGCVDCRAFDSSPWQRRGRINPFSNVNTPEELAQAEVLFRLYS